MVPDLQQRRDCESIGMHVRMHAPLQLQKSEERMRFRPARKASALLVVAATAAIVLIAAMAPAAPSAEIWMV